MSYKTEIEWTDSTWNPVTGCTRITRGCDHCYAERFAERFRGARYRDGKSHYYAHGFDLTLRPQQLDKPLRWRDPRHIFVCSMSDLFHRDIPEDYIDRVFEVMEQTPRHRRLYTIVPTPVLRRPQPPDYQGFW